MFFSFFPLLLFPRKMEVLKLLQNLPSLDDFFYTKVIKTVLNKDLIYE